MVSKPAKWATAVVSTVSLIVFNSIRFQELNGLIAKRDFPMMFFLPPNVLSYFLDVGLTHGESPITTLPAKILQ